MRPWTQVVLLAKREFIQRVTSKTFMVTMAMLTLAILAVGPIAGLVTGGPTEATNIGLVGQEPPSVEQELQAQATVFGIEIEIERFSTRTEAESSLVEGSVAVVVVDGDEVLFHEEASSRLTALVHNAVDTAVKTAALSGMGLSEDEISSVVEPVPLAVTTIGEKDVQNDAETGAAFLGAILLYASVVIFGQFVAMGTVEEKQNRVVEVILSRVRPWQILVGKVVGIGLLGLLQLVILAGAAYTSAQIADFSDIDVASIGLPIIASVIFWFILGYAFYAFLYAAVGSTVSRQEDLQGAIILPVGLILPGYFAAITAAENPDGSIATIASWVPPWAPFVMPVRLATGDPQAWEVVVAVGGTVLGAIALVWIGSRVYAGALLRTGSRVKFREAWRAAEE
jgi:ABC-2 type transport system permease protein